jgi:methionyl-tRNA formyltransferase
MRVVAFVNNAVGLETLRAIQRNGDTIVAVVVHPLESASLHREILDVAIDNDSAVIESTALADSSTIRQLVDLTPDIGVSAFFGHILRSEIIDIFKRGIINLHPSFLPYNRGSYPNVWSIVDGTPIGATIHYIDEGIDTGPIIDQSQIEITPEDTGESLYSRLESACNKLFSRTWPKISQAGGVLPASTQHLAAGTIHRIKDTKQIDCIDIEAQYKASDLLNVIRARTFAGYHGAYFESDGTKYFLQIKIEKENIGDDN